MSGCKHTDPAAAGAIAAPSAEAPPTAGTAAADDEELARLLAAESRSLTPSSDGGPRGGEVVERPVTITGVAHDAVRGAIVLDDSRVPWYVERLERWPAELRGKRVTVSGIARDRKLAPDPAIGPNGERSAGMVGSSHVITQPTWRLTE